MSSQLGHLCIPWSCQLTVLSAVCPGPIWTPLVIATMGKDSLEDFGPSSTFSIAVLPDILPVSCLIPSSTACPPRTSVHRSTPTMIPPLAPFSSARDLADFHSAHRPSRSAR